MTLYHERFKHVTSVNSISGCPRSNIEPLLHRIKRKQEKHQGGIHILLFTGANIKCWQKTWHIEEENVSYGALIMSQMANLISTHLFARKRRLQKSNTLLFVIRINKFCLILAILSKTRWFTLEWFLTNPLADLKIRLHRYSKIRATIKSY